MTFTGHCRGVTCSVTERGDRLYEVDFMESMPGVFKLKNSASEFHGVCVSFANLAFKKIYSTSGFWPRVRTRALRAPVFLGS
jgi:hypothetical protein